MKRFLKKSNVFILIMLCAIFLCQSISAGSWYFKVDYTHSFIGNDGLCIEMAKLPKTTGGSFNRIYTSKNVTKNRRNFTGTTSVSLTNGKVMYYAIKKGEYITIYRYDFTKKKDKKIVKCKGTNLYKCNDNKMYYYLKSGNKKKVYSYSFSSKKIKYVKSI